MHERSLASSLLQQVSQLAHDFRDGHLASVEVEVGPLSGIEPTLFEVAFHDLAVERFGHDVELIMREVPMVLLCETCRQQTRCDTVDFQCDKCGGNSVRVASGDAVILVSVDFATDASPDANSHETAMTVPTRR